MKFYGLLFSALLANSSFAAPVKNLGCRDLEKIYPKLEVSYVKKAPVLQKAGWGKLKEWTSDDFDNFRSSVLQCRDTGFFKKLERAFLEADLDKKIIEMKRESSRMKDDDKIAQTLAEYKSKIDELSKNLDEAKAAELKDLKDIIQRTTGLDESSHFNEAAALENRIDAILLKNPRKKLPAAEAAPEKNTTDEKEELARKEDPKRFKKCGELKDEYEALVAESLDIEKKTVTEGQVEAMAALGKRKDQVLHNMESLSIQMRDMNCKKFFTPATTVN